MHLKDFDFHLPTELIANQPAEPRDSCNLLVLDREKKKIISDVFYNIINFFNKGDVLVLNTSKVIPARIIFNIKGKEAELLLIRKVGENQWICMVKPGRKLKVGSKYQICPEAEFEIESQTEDGFRQVKFNVQNISFEHFLLERGITPLPPYIKPGLSKDDDYQTIYAQENGSVAAPTAGLHFTDKLLEKLHKKGVRIAKALLHVGPGTFLPVKTDDVKKHKMHKEYYELTEKNAKIINDAKSNGKKVIAVGTTAVRILESSCKHGKVKANTGFTDIFIYPGYKWNVVDGLITNFHLPKSTLLMLVSSFAGTDFTKKAYAYAIDHNYRFYSFGDAMLIL
ncbi:tRNA preQ1(34) S-adenosylmethionine ribosyltransferase-isomerase QueA [Candidatus Peregrinibacteria bacterium]|nr:tRNA preQ1(34) S-adenosylmethionine ribosyltransferase-isomerase QueA [Candidatus Peregrinibacteria bacterium]